MEVWFRWNFHFKWVIFRFHVSFRGCTLPQNHWTGHFFCDFTQPGLCQKVAFWFREILGYFRKYPAGWNMIIWPDWFQIVSKPRRCLRFHYTVHKPGVVFFFVFNKFTPMNLPTLQFILQWILKLSSPGPPACMLHQILPFVEKNGGRWRRRGLAMNDISAGFLLAWKKGIGPGVVKNALTIIWICYISLPETNIAPENRPSQKEIWYSNHPFSGAMLVSGRVCVHIFANLG